MKNKGGILPKSHSIKKPSKQRILPPPRPKSSRSQIAPIVSIPPNLHAFYQRLPNSGYLANIPTAVPNNDRDRVINEIAADYLTRINNNQNLIPDVFNHGGGIGNAIDTRLNNNNIPPSIDLALSLRDSINANGTMIPDNSRASHEITHLKSLDTQYEPQMWQLLNHMHNANPANYTQNYNRMRNIVDSSGVFRNQANYNIDQNRLNQAMTDVNNGNGGGAPYYTTINGRVVSNDGGIDEVPAFISQNLHRNWNAGTTINNPLHNPQQPNLNIPQRIPNPNPAPVEVRNFLQGMTQEMSNNTPQQANPTTHRLLNDRRNSLFKKGGYIRPRKSAHGDQVQRFDQGAHVANHAAESRGHLNNLRKIREYLDRM